MLPAEIRQSHEFETLLSPLAANPRSSKGELYVCENIAVVEQRA